MPEKFSNKSTLQLCLLEKEEKKKKPTTFFKQAPGFELFHFIKGYS